jgi:hypothetical protein
MAEDLIKRWGYPLLVIVIWSLFLTTQARPREADGSTASIPTWMNLY